MDTGPVTLATERAVRARPGASHGDAMGTGWDNNAAGSGDAATTNEDPVAAPCAGARAGAALGVEVGNSIVVEGRADAVGRAEEVMAMDPPPPAPGNMTEGMFTDTGDIANMRGCCMTIGDSIVCWGCCIIMGPAGVCTTTVDPGCCCIIIIGACMGCGDICCCIIIIIGACIGCGDASCGG